MHVKLLTSARTAAAVLILTVLLTTMAGCGGGLSTILTEPIGDGMLLIGSILVENVGYGQRQESYTKDIEVSFMSDVVENGRTVRKSLTIFADPNGYFAVENVPNGKYALKGIRAFTPGGDWTVWNELRLPNERWAMAGAQHYYPFTGEYFPTSPVGNIYNFHHNIFSLLLGGDVRNYQASTLENASFHLTESYTRSLVVDYFIDKYPDSGWTPMLREMQGRQRPPEN